MIKALISLSILLITLLLLLVAILYIFQQKLLYPAPAFPVTKALPPNTSKIDLKLSYAYLLRPSGALAHEKDVAHPLIIFTHGNGELADFWLNQFDLVLASGIAVLLVEYTCYGDAKGSPNIKSITDTVVEAYDKVVELPFIDESFIIPYGRSIGGGAAAILAFNRPVAALGLESTFSSLPKLVSEKSIPSILLKDRYNNEAIVQSLDIPIFIYHGTKDTLIPFSHAQTLNAASKHATFISERCGHNDCPAKWRELIEFLRQIEKPDIE
ncbi:alpha/beta hydrolase [Ningiella sp. W23]|uniref:alpha/beta hydrolase n=1 Tax=Ningiella sp. W23 TaxID=3023715 RepID=UPI0037573062